MSENNDNKKPERPEVPPEVKARQDSVNVFVKEITFLMMYQVGFVKDGDISVFVHVEDGFIKSFDFSVAGKRVCQTSEGKKEDG